MKIMNILAVMIVCFLAFGFAAGCKTQQVSVKKTAIETPESAGEAMGEEIAESEEAPEETAGGEAGKETAEAEEAMPSESNIEIVSEKTIIGTSSQPDRKIIEGESWFSNVVCGQLFSDGESYLTFTFENKYEKDYSLVNIRYAEIEEKNPLTLTANNLDVRKSAKESCGVEKLKSGEKVTCRVKLLLRKGKDTWGKELFNRLEADALDFNTQLKFKCAGMAEEKATA